MKVCLNILRVVNNFVYEKTRCSKSSRLLRYLKTSVTFQTANRISRKHPWEKNPRNGTNRESLNPLLSGDSSSSSFEVLIKFNATFLIFSPSLSTIQPARHSVPFDFLREIACPRDSHTIRDKPSPSVETRFRSRVNGIRRVKRIVEEGEREKEKKNKKKTFYSPPSPPPIRSNVSERVD